MNQLAATLTCLVLSLSLAVNLTAQKELVLKKCAATFGEPIDKELNLFPLDSDFVVSVQFTKKGKLTQIAVTPKYFFSDAHSEWLEPKTLPHLQSNTPQRVVSLIDSISSLGTIKKRSTGIWITNSTSNSEDCYENAVVLFAAALDPLGEKPAVPSKIRFIRVRYDAKCNSR